MTPSERKAELVRRDITLTQIARATGYAISTVHMVVMGRRRTPAVRQAVAEAIGLTVEQVFEAAA